MPIVANTDFGVKYKLANTALSDTEGAELALFSANSEKDYLTDILGYKMAKEFIEAVDANVASGKWFDLWKGSEFTDKFGRLNNWPGFSNSQDLSPIVMFVYYGWQKEKQTYTSGSGERLVLTENSTPTPVRGKLVRAWNNMVKMNFILDDFIRQKKQVYADYKGIHDGNYKYFTEINIYNV